MIRIAKVTFTVSHTPAPGNVQQLIQRLLNKNSVLQWMSAKYFVHVIRRVCSHVLNRRVKAISIRRLMDYISMVYLGNWLNAINLIIKWNNENFTHFQKIFKI